MISGKSVLGLVTARGGSKGLPGKNIRELCGKPLIAWTIEAGRRAKYLDALVVSTDDAAIAEVARRYGADVPFMRPAHLATDTASSIDVAVHAVDFLHTARRNYDLLVLLEPTSPLREAADIDAALELLLSSRAASVVSVCRAEAAHPAFMYRLDQAARLRPFLERQPNGLRRQEIEPLYFLEGTVYATRIDVLLARRSFYHDDTVGYEVPKWKSPEIDDEIDLLFVEAIMRRGTMAKESG